MHALSLKQPWATLLVHGLKSIEVRRWSTPRRGRVLIHAARIPDNRPEAWRHVPRELREQAEVVQGMARELSSEMARERSEFILAHQALLDKVIEASARVARERAELQRQEQRVKDVNGLIKRRQDDVKYYQDELAKTQKSTAAELKKLKDMTEQLFKLRLEARDALARNAELEKKIHELERKVQQAEKEAEK
jgi:hypothetical protein